MVDFIFAGFYFIFIIAFAFLTWLNMRQFDKESAKWSAERDKWNVERSKLLDRIQSGGLAEFKAQERADTSIVRREKDPLVAKLESEPWL